jgi:hypothetical protein
MVLILRNGLARTRAMLPCRDYATGGRVIR